MERKFIKKIVIAYTILLQSIVLSAQNMQKKDSLWINVISDECIYDNNNHAAFTSLEEWGGHQYLAFREAGAHRATPTDKGKIRVLKKKNNEWSLQHTFFMDGRDLRDPDIVKWNNRLLLYTSGHYSELTRSGWTELKSINHNAPYKPSIWKKRVHNNILYGIGNAEGKWPLLMNSEDGINWKVISEYKLGGNATEADMVFIADTMYICIRIDTPVGSNSLWGKSVYPYTKCHWSVMDISVASPEMIIHSKHTILLAGREYDYHRKDGKNARYVSLFALNTDGCVKARHIVERQGGDQGYTSFCKIKNDGYMMSYYAGIRNTAVRMLTFRINENKLN